MIERKYYEVYGTRWLGDQIANCQDCDWVWEDDDLGDERDDGAQDHIDQYPTHVVILGDKRLRYLRKRAAIDD